MEDLSRRRPAVSLVLDSSATLAWVFGEETTEPIGQVFDAVADQGAVVPSALRRLEVANCLSVAVRRGRIDHAFRQAALEDLGELNIFIDNQTDSRAWNSTLDLADRFRLGVYDGAYVKLGGRCTWPRSIGTCGARARARGWGYGCSASTDAARRATPAAPCQRNSCEEQKARVAVGPKEPQSRRGVRALDLRQLPDEMCSVGEPADERDRAAPDEQDRRQRQRRRRRFASNGKRKAVASMEGSPDAQRLTAILSWCAAESYVREAGKPTKAVELALLQEGCWHNIPITLIL